MIFMIAHFDEMEILRVEIDEKTQVNMIIENIRVQRIWEWYKKIWIKYKKCGEYTKKIEECTKNAKIIRKMW